MSARNQGVTVEELLAFNDELRALARAGVPLEHGLSALGSDLPGRLGRLATAISVRMERGEGLVAVLNDPQLALPPVYAAVVAAGIRAGHLPAALESLSRSLTRAIELRRTMLVSLLYPAILLLLASGVFVFTWTKLYPHLQESITSLVERGMPTWFRWLGLSAQYGTTWLAVIWAVIGFGGLWWLIRTRSASSFSVGRRLPSLRTVNAAGRVATFAETLALLLEHQIPLVEALQLAGASSGDSKVKTASEALVQRLQTGNLAGPGPKGLPPLLSWLILTNASSARLVRTLRQTAAAKRDYAARASLMLGLYLPIVCSACVGAFVAIYYAILVMIPFLYLLNELGQP